MYFPTWLDNILLLVTFVMVTVQHRIINPAHTIRNSRFGMMFVCVVMLLLTSFYNRKAGWLSVGLFVAVLACMGTVLYMFRTIPPKSARD